MTDISPAAIHEIDVVMVLAYADEAALRALAGQFY
jgi:hypothetical protein